MPKLGGYSPFPLRLGGGRPRVETLTNALNADRGDAFDTHNRETIAYVIDHAAARGLSAGWSTNARLGHLWDPLRMSEDVLVRWEKVLALAPAPGDTLGRRRERLLTVFEGFGQPAWVSTLEAALEFELGDAFVAIEFIDSSIANIIVPDGTYPWGVVGSVPWSSSVAHVLVLLQKPASWTEGDFYDAAAKVVLILDPVLPAWVTFDWYRAPEAGAPVDVSGGPSAAGFYLDELNLDNSVFDA